MLDLFSMLTILYFIGLAIPEKIGYQSLLEEAMQSGYVLCNVAVIMMIGVAGAGKTSFLQLVLNQPPLTKRRSTPLAKCAIRAVSISRAAVSEGGVVWKAVTPKILLEMLGDGIAGDVAFLLEEPLVTSVTKPIPIQQISDDPTQVESDVTAGVVDSSVSQPVAQHPAIKAVESLATPSRPSYQKLSGAKPIQQLIVYMKKVKRSGKVFEREWVYIIDSGGQPQFIDLIPSYVRNVSGAAIFVKLDEEFGSRPKIAYYSREGKLCGIPYMSSLTHMQTIQNCLQVMQSRRTVSGEVECPKLFFIGTHRDREHLCKENRESKNKQLLDMLLPRESLKPHLSYYSMSNQDQLIYPVNAKRPKPEDYKVVEEFREHVMRKCKKLEMKIPLRWFILEQQIQQLAEERGSAVLSLEDCRKVASDLEMDESRLLAAINYFVRLNLFQYLPDVLPKVVFTTCQVLLDKVSELIELIHRIRGKVGKLAKLVHFGKDEDLVKFKDHGIVSVEFLQNFPKHYVEGLFTSKELLQVLINQLVFAQGDEGVYFMPCATLDLPLEKVSEHRLTDSSSPVSPVLFYYPGGLFPGSIFNGLVAFLQNRSSWKVATKDGKPSCVYKNCVKFKHTEHAVIIALIYSFNYMEVHAQIPQDLCLEFVEVIFEGLSEAARVQNYTNLQADLGFFCSCKSSSHSLHLATFNPKSPFKLSCSVNDEYIGKITEPKQAWLNELNMDSFTTLTGTVIIIMPTPIMDNYLICDKIYEPVDT